MKPDHTLTAARLRELMRYEDGQLFWRTHTSPKMKHGPLGAPAGHGRRLQTPVDGRAQYIHRLVWLYHHGSWPVSQLDHINGDKLDNRIENLRELTGSENMQNRRIRGVTYEQRAGKWRARIMVKGRSVNLGYFATEQAALDEYQRAKLLYHPAWVSGIAGAA